jgi:hypothetical protein
MYVLALISADMGAAFSNAICIQKFDPSSLQRQAQLGQGLSAGLSLSGFKIAYGGCRYTRQFRKLIPIDV